MGELIEVRKIREKPASHRCVGLLLACFMVVVVVLGCFGFNSSTDERLFPVNETGLTYGSMANLADPSQTPDLISAVATNGERGYIKKAELDEASMSASSPAEAVELMEEKEERLLSAFLGFYNGNVAAESRLTEDEASRIFDAIHAGGLDLDADNALSSGQSLAGEFAPSMQLDVAVAKDAYEKAVQSMVAYIPVYLSDGETIVGEFPVG